MSKRSASITKSSNMYNNTHLSTSSSTASNKFSTRTTSSFDKHVYNKRGELVGQTHSIKVNDSSNVTSGIIGSSFSIIFAILVLINLFQVLMNTGEFRGVEWFLEVLSNAPQVPTGWLETWGQMNIDSSSWGVFEWFGNLLNKFNDFFNICAFLSIGCVNIITFVVYLVGSFLFAGI